MAARGLSALRVPPPGMDRASLSRASRAIALIGLALLSTAVQAGIHRHLLTAIFTFEQHPDLPLRTFAGGKLGILQPTYARSYLYTAYRWIEGAPMDAAESAALDRYWQERLAPSQKTPQPTAQQAYDSVRGSLDIPWQAPPQPNEQAQAQYLAVDYVYYSKCSDDGFAKAAETLQARINRFGARSLEVSEWVVGQDYVFENCFGSGSGFIPPPVRLQVDPLIHADREYQRAAALFYSSRYREAVDAFRQIAADTSSPWAGWGQYLAGRALLWQARTNTPDSAPYRLVLGEAAEQLRQAAGGEGAAEARDAARWLLGRIWMRTEPGKAAALLSQRLMSPLGAPTRVEEITLFTQLMDNLAANSGALSNARKQDDTLDWIFTFQEQGDASVEHAIERWRAKRSVAWLAAAISKVSGEHPAAQDLVAAAENVNSHPASPTLSFHVARLLAERGEKVRARGVADRLSGDLRGFDSSRNRALSLRATLADKAEELLFYGVRPPAFVSFVFWGDGAYYNPWQLEDADKIQAQPYRKSMYWGPETAEMLNEAVAVDALAAMLAVKGQPARLKTELVLACWTRALLLERWDLVRKLAPEVGDAVASMREDTARLLQTTEPERMRYFAAAGLLKTPGASILLRSGPIRTEPPETISYENLNWWPADWPTAGLAAFLPDQDRAFVQGEWTKIREAGGGYVWLTRQLIAEAERAEPHSSVPENLYRAVVGLDGVDLTWGYPGPALADRSGMRDMRAKAVETLQRLFSGSEWTKKAIDAKAAKEWY